MRSMSRRAAAALTALALTGLAAGCSSGPGVAAKDAPDTAAPTTTSAAAAPTTTTPAPTATPAAETSAAPSPVPQVEGTSWAGTDSDGDYYVYRFKANGRFAYTSPSGSFDQADDTWSQSGDQVTMRTRNGFSTRIGTINGDTMAGTASNVQGHTWTWTNTRQ